MLPFQFLLQLIDPTAYKPSSFQMVEMSTNQGLHDPDRGERDLSNGQTVSHFEKFWINLFSEYQINYFSLQYILKMNKK